MPGDHRSGSLPQLSVISTDGEEHEVDDDEDQKYIGDNTSSIISPLTPKLTPTFRSQNLSPFWFSSASNTPELPQVTGSTSDSPAGGSAGSNQAAALSMLHAAAITGNTDGLERLASGNFCDIDLRDKFGRTPLMYAVLGNFPECVDILIKNDSDVSLTDSSGRTALHWAVHHGYGGCVKIILRCKVEWDVADQAGVTVLHLAMRHDKSVLQQLLKKFSISKEDINVVDVNKRSPLHWAGAHGNYDQAKIVSKLGADIGIIDVEGKTALHWAATSKSTEPQKLINLLVNMKTKGSSSVLCWQDYEGRQPIHLAVLANNDKMVSAMTNQSSCMINALDHRSRTGLHWAAVQGLKDIVYILLEAEAKSDLLDESGASSAHLAVQSGDTDTFKVFVDRKLVDNLDSQKRTPLMWAVALERIELIELFTEADLDALDKFGYSALHIGVSNNVSDPLKALLRLGADINLRNGEGETPLILACKLGHNDIVNILLEHEANIELTDDQGKSCVHVVSSTGHPALLQELIKLGANVNQQDILGRTPLMMACYGGHSNIVKELLEAGADLDHQDNDGMCSLHWAVKKGDIEIVKMLLGRLTYVNNVARMNDDELEDDRRTPLDTAIAMDNNDIIEMLIQHKAVTIARIYNIAATRIQAYYKGHKIRNTYTKEVKNLMVKHLKLVKEKEHVKKERKKKRKSKRKNKSDVPSLTVNDRASSAKSDVNLHSPKARIAEVAGDFLGSVVEGHQRSSYLRRVQPGEDEPLPETRHRMVRSKSESSGHHGHHHHHRRTESELESSEKHNLRLSSKDRSESRFSYNLNR